VYKARFHFGGKFGPPTPNWGPTPNWAPLGLGKLSFSVSLNKIGGFKNRPIPIGGHFGATLGPNWGYWGIYKKY